MLGRPSADKVCSGIESSKARTRNKARHDMQGNLHITFRQPQSKPPPWTIGKPRTHRPLPSPPGSSSSSPECTNHPPSAHHGIHQGWAGAHLEHQREIHLPQDVALMVCREESQRTRKFKHAAKLRPGPPAFAASDRGRAGTVLTVSRIYHDL